MQSIKLLPIELLSEIANFEEGLILKFASLNSDYMKKIRNYTEKGIIESNCKRVIFDEKSCIFKNHMDESISQKKIKKNKRFPEPLFFTFYRKARFWLSKRIMDYANHYSAKLSKITDVELIMCYAIDNTAVRKILPIFNNITDLGILTRDLELIDLSEFKQLRNLWIRGMSCDELTKLELPDCTTLETLKLTCVMVTKKKLQYPNMKALTIEESTMLCSFAPFGKCQKLSFCNSSISDEEFSNFSCVEELSIHSCSNLTNKVTKYFGRIKTLDILACKNISFSESSELSDVECLSINSMSYFSPMQYLSKMDNLKYFENVRRLKFSMYPGRGRFTDLINLKNLIELETDDATFSNLIFPALYSKFPITSGIMKYLKLLLYKSPVSVSQSKKTMVDPFFKKLKILKITEMCLEVMSSFLKVYMIHFPVLEVLDITGRYAEFFIGELKNPTKLILLPKSSFA
jgi:hypothetical protein